MHDRKKCENDLFADVTDPSETACEFLKKLDKASDRRQGQWIFRGQNDAIWDLMPSLFRDRENELSQDYEMRLISNFIRNVNLVNLPIPSNSLSFESSLLDQMIVVTTTIESESEPKEYVKAYDFGHVAVALAQHSGMHTRLLDFTYDPPVAAYFAGTDIENLLDNLGLYPGERELSDSRKRVFLRRCLESIDDSVTVKSILSEYRQECDKAHTRLPKDIAVWGIDTQKLFGTTLRLLDFPYDQILNLRAQMGTFICDTGLHDTVELHRQAFASQLTKLAETNGIVKLTLPFSKRVKLSRLLRAKRVSPLYLKPSYEKVADAALRVTRK